MGAVLGPRQLRQNVGADLRHADYGGGDPRKLAAGESVEQLIGAHPRLTDEAIRCREDHSSRRRLPPLPGGGGCS